MRIGELHQQAVQSDSPARFRQSAEGCVKIAFGTDVGGFPWTENEAKDFAYMVQCGMTPMQAIKSATSVAAALLDQDGKIGEITPGAYADIVAVRENPLKDTTLLECVAFVMKDGEVVTNELKH
jgi:imidazolonepropionase-like amidohydrolase